MGKLTNKVLYDVSEKLSVGKSGLDIVFAVDVSSSIGPISLNNAKRFIKIICDKFGISEDPTGGISLLFTFPKQSLDVMILKKPFENNVGNGENAVNQHFLLFLHYFLSYQNNLKNLSKIYFVV